jgi:pyruvate dehydrogenase E2 component (dihydrolipoamide acetyltransferase)
MATEVKLPQFGMGMSEATVIRWYKSPGDSVTKGEPLLEVEAAKSINEIPAPLSGVLASIVAPNDTVVPVYGALGFIAAEGEIAAAPVQAAAAGPAIQVESEPMVGRGTGSEGHVDGNATPRARRLARELGVDLSTVEGTGPGGRITDDDVQAAAPGKSSRDG